MGCHQHDRGPASVAIFEFVPQLMKCKIRVTHAYTHTKHVTEDTSSSSWTGVQKQMLNSQDQCCIYADIRPLQPITKIQHFQTAVKNAEIIKKCLP